LVMQPSRTILSNLVNKVNYRRTPHNIDRFAADSATCMAYAAGALAYYGG
jgi:hypothetical protein